MLVQTFVKDISVLRHGDDFSTLATRIQIAEFKEHLSKYLLVKHMATLGPCDTMGCTTVWKCARAY